MRNPFQVARLAAFTISLLLLLEVLEPGWGIEGGWGWYLGLFFLTLLTAWDLVSLIACILAFCLLVGILDESRAAFIALTIFTGFALIRPRGPQGAARLGWRAWTWQADRRWRPDGPVSHHWSDQ
jgi:hypothetical protein